MQFSGFKLLKIAWIYTFKLFKLLGEGKLKYDYIYLNPAGDGFELNEGIQNHNDCYPHYEIHHATEQTPEERYQQSKKIHQNNMMSIQYLNLAN